MTPGQVVTLRDAAQVRAFQIRGGSGTREYEVVVQSAAETPGASSMKLVVKAAGASADVTPLSPRVRAARTTRDREMALRASSNALETALKAQMREELLRRGAQPARPRRDVSASVVSGSAAPPQLGEMMTLGFAVVASGSNIFADCNSTATVTGEVKFVGSNFTIVEDVQLAGRFSSAEIDAIGQELDAFVHPVATAYFGDPADIDQNQTVIALITAEVNKLTPAGSGSIIAGFFFSGDLSSKQNCPVSNEGEIFYLIGPDNGGQFGEPIDQEFANTLARTTVAHEYLHLLNTQQRVTIGGGGFNDREDAWLDEALAHLSEEVVGLAVGNLGTRSNLDLLDATVTTGQLDAYNDYHLLNFDRFGRFLQGGCPPRAEGPAVVQALGDATGEDPGGVESLLFRGYGHGFVRWLGDHFGPTGSGVLPGSREEMLFRELSSGGPAFARGIANVERAIQAVAGSSLQWEDLLALYMASLVADDNAPAGTDPRTQFRTWDMRGMYQQLQLSNLGNSCPWNREYPLVPATVTLSAATNASLNFSVMASTGRFVTMAGSSPPDQIVELTTGAGANLPSSARAQITIIRTR